MMSLEVRLEKLETQHRNIDEEVHGLARVCADIKNIALTNQHDISDIKNLALKNQHDISGLQAAISALAEATHAGFRCTDEKLAQHDARFDQIETHLAQHDARFDQLELLIRQTLPSN